MELFILGILSLILSYIDRRLYRRRKYTGTNLENTLVSVLIVTNYMGAVFLFY